MKLRKLLVLLMLVAFALVLSACGAQGEKGPQGPQGDKGDTGATGATGDKGDQGEAGDDGEAGADGVGIEFSFTSEGLAWRYVGSKSWNVGVEYSEIFAIMNEAGIGAKVQEVGFDYYVGPQAAELEEGAALNVYGKDLVAGTDAFATLEEAFTAIDNASADAGYTGCKLFVDKGTYEEEVTLNADKVLIYGPNIDVDPNLETRVGEAYITNVINVAGDDVELNGLKFGGACKLVGADTGIDNFKVAYCYFDETISLSSSAEGCITLKTTDDEAGAQNWFKNFQLLFTLFDTAQARATRIVANQVDGFICVGNVFNGKSNGTYDDCIKFYLPSTTVGKVAFTGDAKIYGNTFNQVGQYTVWFNLYGPMNLDVQANKFINCGMTDSKEAQADNGYYRGVLSVLLCANYDTTKKTTINFAYNTVSESSCGVRAQSKNGTTVLTAETFECKVNYNIFEDIALSNEIVTSRGNSEGSLIDAQYNFYNVEVTLEANFRGVASIDNAYASANAVPKKTLEDLTW